MTRIDDVIMINRIMIIGILNGFGMNEKEIIEYFNKAKKRKQRKREKIK